MDGKLYISKLYEAFIESLEINNTRPNKQQTCLLKSDINMMQNVKQHFKNYACLYKEVLFIQWTRYNLA